MKKLLNTLYVTSSDRYLALDGENVVIKCMDEEVARIPLHNLEGIMTFGYTGVSPALMGACADRGISLCFMKPSGKFLARVTGEINGNVLLRREQYRISDAEERRIGIARNMILAKIYNSKWVIERATRDYPLRVDVERLKEKSEHLSNALHDVKNAQDLDELRGIEGKAAAEYFSVFDDFILQQKEDFCFRTRNKRPPLDPVNAMLSFAYALLKGLCSSALEAVGLDAYVGFMHTERPGRESLALDLMEEFRAVMADRFVLTLINKKIVSISGFVKKESGAVIMDDKTRSAFLSAWQTKKQEVISHPFLNEKVEWGIVPYAQAMLLARYIRGDIDGYPPFMWK